MNKSDRASLKKVSIILEEQKNILEELECDLENRECNLSECFPDKAEIISEEVNQVWELKDGLETVINNMEELL